MGEESRGSGWVYQIHERGLYREGVATAGNWVSVSTGRIPHRESVVWAAVFTGARFSVASIIPLEGVRG